MIDFTGCKLNNLAAYGGNNGSKISIEYRGKIYMLKFPPHAKNTNAISYTNSCISEYIGCHIFNMLGVPAQGTLLGKYYYKGKERVVVACEDFTAEGSLLYEFAKIKNSVLESTHGGQGLDFEDVLLTINEQNMCSSLLLRRRFWQMFVVDAYIGNFDRNNSNWGLLIDKNHQVSLAPVYDCGGCLYPQLDDESMERILQDEVEIKNRVYVFPNSIYKINDRKINYLDFLINTQDVECRQALQDIVGKIDEKKINVVIDNIECISKIRKEFYKTMLHYRKLWILDAAMQGGK